MSQENPGYAKANYVHYFTFTNFFSASCHSHLLHLSEKMLRNLTLQRAETPIPQINMLYEGQTIRNFD